MTDLRAIIERIPGLSQRGSAKRMGLNERQPRRWVESEKPNKHIVAVFLLVEELSAATGEPAADILRRMYGGEG